MKIQRCEGIGELLNANLLQLSIVDIIKFKPVVGDRMSPSKEVEETFTC